jgi:hypothetical protein
MKPTMSRSRKTLHLPRERNICTSPALADNIDDASPQRSDHDGKSGRVIVIRYRCGSAIDPAVVSTAVDMRKRFFSSANMQRLH